MQINEKSTNKVHTNNAFTAFYEQEQSKQTLNRFSNELTDKPYFIEAKQLFTLSKWGSMVTAVVSALLAYEFMNRTLHDALPSLFGAIGVGFICILILFGIEYFKRVYLNGVFIELVKRKSIKPFALLGASLLIGLSFYLSVQGTLDYTTRRGNEQTKLLNERSDKNIDNLKAANDAVVSKLESKIKAINDRNTYKGKTWLPKTERKLVQALENQILTSNKELTESIKQAEKEHQFIKQAQSTSTNETGLRMALISSVNELLCVLCLWFGFNYKFRSLIEYDLAQIGALKPAILAPKNSKSILPNLTRELTGFSGWPPSNKDTECSTEYGKENTDKSLTNTDLKAEALKDILQGCKDFRTLAQRHKLNMNQVKAHINFIDQLR